MSGLACPVLVLLMASAAGAKPPPEVKAIDKQCDAATNLDDARKKDLRVLGSAATLP